MTTTDNPAAMPGSLRGHVTDRAGQPDLTGNLAPVAVELDVTGLRVTGELPPGLRGSFVRNGPNPLFEPTGRYNLLDGDGMLHGVTLGDGTASYRNRWIRSRGLEAEATLGRAIYPGLGNVMDFPDRSPDRRRRAREERGEHPHHPPRRPDAGAVGGRPAHRGHAVARHRRRARLRRAAARRHDRPPPLRPPHR